MDQLRRPTLGALTLVLGAVLALGGIAPTRAQDADKKVTLNLKDTPLRSAIDALFQGTGLQYAVDPNVPNIPVTLSLRDIGLQAALRILVRQGASAVPGLTSSREGDIFLVKIRPAVTAAPPMVEDTPPEYSASATEMVWEKITIQFNNVAVFVLAFGGTMLPSEADVLLRSQSGNGGNNGGGYGSSGFGNSGFGNSGFGGSGVGSGGLSGLGGLGGTSGLGNTTSGTRF